MTERLALSAQEVGDLLGVGKHTIYRACTRGEIPSLRVGDRVLIPRRWLEEKLDTSTAAVSDALDAPESGTADGPTAERPPPAQTDNQVEGPGPEAVPHAQAQ